MGRLVRPALETIAQRLHADVMAPLVLGGPLRPGRVIGARAALALAALETPCDDVELDRRVQAGRLRQVRKLVPINTLGPASGAEWMLAAALNDLLQCANPTLDRPLRRGAAARILDRAAATIDRVRAPASALEAVSRHSWLARVLDIERRDTRVSWWVGARTFLGVEPSRRLLAWPNLRRVKVEVASHSWALLAPPAVRRERLTIALGRLLERTPLTDVATCARAAPPFAWCSTTLAFVATQAGRTLTLRALARLPAPGVDAALGRATRDALARWPDAAQVAVELLADRAIARAQTQWTAARATADGSLTTSGVSLSDQDAAFARELGAAAARRALESEQSIWSETERRSLLSYLRP
jgi:hypothetical protein